MQNQKLKQDIDNCNKVISELRKNPHINLLLKDVSDDNLSGVAWQIVCALGLGNKEDYV